MTTFRQKLAGVTVLGIVSGVSLLAGGIMLGGASADGGKNDKPTLNIMEGAPENIRMLSTVVNGEGGCFIAYGGEGHIDPSEFKAGVPFGAMKVEGPINIRNAAGAGNVTAENVNVEKKFSIAPGDAKDAPVLRHAIEAKPISAEEIERLKASGELKTFSPEDCKVVTPEEMEDLVPGDLKKAR